MCTTVSHSRLYATPPPPSITDAIWRPGESRRGNDGGMSKTAQNSFVFKGKKNIYAYFTLMDEYLMSGNSRLSRTGLPQVTRGGGLLPEPTCQEALLLVVLRVHRVHVLGITRVQQGQ